MNQINKKKLFKSKIFTNLQCEKEQIQNPQLSLFIPVATVGKQDLLHQSPRFHST